MNRRSFRTKNTLELHSLVYITVMCFVLLIFFLALANVGKIVSYAGLDSGKADPEVIGQALEEGTDDLLAKRIEGGSDTGRAEVFSRFTGGNGGGGALKTALWGDQPILDSLCSQLMIMEQSYDRISSLENMEDYDLLVIGSDTMSDEDIEDIASFVRQGGNVWFTSLDRKLAVNESLKDYLGLLSCGKARRWPGLRFSGDIAAGSILENTKYKVRGLEVELENKAKVYACALPKEYKELEFEDLPPLIWRHIANDGYGGVYVCNGDFMDGEVVYLMLPTIFSELQGNYVYGVINAYCAFVEGFPYAQNEERDTWQRFFSRDKMAIAQDLLSSQYLRYNTGYGAHMTYFSRDYQTFLETEDKDLRYYTDSIESSMGLLALKQGEDLFLESDREKLDISDWQPGAVFAENGNYCLPIDYEYTIDNKEESTFDLLGSAMGLGYYVFTNDVDKLLDSEEDIWDEYCKYQEVVFGIGEQQCGWLSRLTAAQALQRLSEHLNADTVIEYGEGTVDITTDAKNYWLIFKGKAGEIEITGGTAERIGNGCWLIGVDGGHAVIRYS